MEIVLTGDRPTGRLHLGHYIGSLKNRLKLQENCRQFIMIADLQALTDNADNPKKIRENVLEVFLDYLAVGIDPLKSTIFIQSLIRAIPELTLYYLNLVTWNRLKHNPTVKQELSQKGYGQQVPAGFIIYPINQAADITAFKATIVPVGEDQLPMIEQTNEIVRRFNAVYQTDILFEAKAMIPEKGRLSGLDGKKKMSKSLNNAIYLSDPADVVTKKVMGMYTDPHHLRVEDPGRTEENPVFEYLDLFDPDQDRLMRMKEQYRSGGLGDVVVKRHLNDVLQQFLRPIYENRLRFFKDKEDVLNLLKEGSVEANAVADQTLLEVRRAMHIDYYTEVS